MYNLKFKKFKANLAIIKFFLILIIENLILKMCKKVYQIFLKVLNRIIKLKIELLSKNFIQHFISNLELKVYKKKVNFIKNNASKLIYKNFLNKILNFNNYNEYTLFDYNHPNINKFEWPSYDYKSIVISLNPTCNRFKFTKSQLNKLHLYPNLFKAITPNQVNEIFLKSNLIRDLNKKKLACIASHLKAIKYCLENFNNDVFLILEDDVILFPDPEIVDFSKAYKNPDWEIMRIEHASIDTFNKSQEAFHSGYLLQGWNINFDIGSAAYFIKREYAEKLINKYFVILNNIEKINLDKSYLTDPKFLVADRVVFNNANCFNFTFPLAYQNLDYKSDIGYKANTNFKRIITTSLIRNLWTKTYNYKNSFKV